MMHCNPDSCPHCQYIGEGDSWCDEIHEIVLSDWEPTEHYMGQGCPYLAQPRRRKRRRKKKGPDAGAIVRSPRRRPRSGWKRTSAGSRRCSLSTAMKCWPLPARRVLRRYARHEERIS